MKYLGDSNLRRILQYKSYKTHEFNVPGKRVQLGIQMAIGGQTIDQLRKRVSKAGRRNCMWQLDERLFIMIGTNDILRDKSYVSIKKSIKRLLKALGGKSLTFFTVLPMVGPAYSEEREQKRVYLNKLLMESSHLVINLDQRPDNTVNRYYFRVDGIHLNRRGLVRVRHLF